jgi:hypothetical protein
MILGSMFLAIRSGLLLAIAHEGVLAKGCQELEMRRPGPS